MTKCAIVVCCASLLTASCARYGSEQLLLEQFFSASRLRDRTALQQIATVVFEPREQGTVTEFSVIDVTAPEAPAGQPQTEQVTVQAPVRLPDGATATRRMLIVLERRAQWIVTGFTMVAPG